MSFLSTIKLVVRTLLARKGRSFLTILGIIIGVGGVITIIALGAGAQSLVLGQVTKLGTNLLYVQPWTGSENGPPSTVFGVVITTLTNEDADALRDKGRVPHAVAVNPSVQGTATITWGTANVDTNFTATDFNYPVGVNFTMREGRFFSEQEDRGDANVIVLGSTVAEELFGGTGIDPVGQTVKAKTASQKEPGGIPLRVSGVINSRGSSFFQDQDDMVFMPLGIGQKQMLGIRYLQGIGIKVDSADTVSSTAADITQVLKERHRIKEDVDLDFIIRNQAEAINILSTITNALKLFLVSMAGIALVVAGIGILNIMLVTVAERTREIGLRKAVGATNAAIRNQFLFEAGTLTLLGGMFGIVGGVVVSYLAAIIMRSLDYDWAFVISPSSVVLAVGVSILTGVVFGLYPALKASRLNPIDALRYE
ncbi:MAG: ABC transporter permease [bacterium]|nr:ABC transporter permease [bacterium]